MINVNRRIESRVLITHKKSSKKLFHYVGVSYNIKQDIVEKVCETLSIQNYEIFSQINSNLKNK